MAAADTRRRVIERDLHDGAQQELIALAWRTQKAAQDLRRMGDTTSAVLLDRAVEQARTALDELRTVAHGIYPSVLANEGLETALRTWTVTAEVPVAVTGTLPRLTRQAEMALYVYATTALEALVRGRAVSVDIHLGSAGDARVVQLDAQPSTSITLSRSSRTASVHWAALSPRTVYPQRCRRPRHQLISTRCFDVPTPPRRLSPMRVVVADDSLLMRRGILETLRGAGHDVVSEVGDARALLAAVDLEEPQVAVVDIRMPPSHTTEGLEAAQRIRSEHPNVAVLILSQYVEPAYALRLLADNPGSVGYLIKERILDAHVLVDAVARVADGQTLVDPTIVAQLLGKLRRDDPLDRLSERERGVLALLAEGCSNRAIAARLVVSERTVEAHVRNLFDKLDLADTPEHHRRVLAVIAYLRG